MLAFALAGGMAGAAAASAAGDLPAAAAGSAAPPGTVCERLAAAPWPPNAVERRAQLLRFEAQRPHCLHDAAFLAALGGLLLEDGEPEQALVWLERSLMLEAGNLGAQADLALALAAIGQPEALDALVRAWQARPDVPLALRRRLTETRAARLSAPLSPLRLGGEVLRRWKSYREASLLLGYDSNLNFSPRLAEITLTPPGGPIDLPLVNPLAPRPGAATIADLAWHLARDAGEGRVWRTGVRAAGRAAATEPDSNWLHLQWAGGWSQQWNSWRTSLDATATWVGGPLNDPSYRSLFLAASAERTQAGCVLRGTLEAEFRAQPGTARSNVAGRTGGLLGSALCALPSAGGWRAGAAVRASVDLPTDADRPGGIRRLASAGVRLLGPLDALAPRARLDGTLRWTRVLDDQGYSPLLQDGARRVVDQALLWVELSAPLRLDGWPAAEWVAQAQAVKQKSNLSLFGHSGASVYGGVRWAW